MDCQARIARFRAIVAWGCPQAGVLFGKHTERAASRFRYLPPTILGKLIGCIGEKQNVNYRIPGI